MSAAKPTHPSGLVPSIERRTDVVDHHAHNPNIMRNTCDRCGAGPSVTTTMSRFNTDILCIPCNAKECAHPEYDSAVEANHVEELKGNITYPGIGKPRDL